VFCYNNPINYRDPMGLCGTNNVPPFTITWPTNGVPWSWPTNVPPLDFRQPSWYRDGTIDYPAGPGPGSGVTGNGPAPVNGGYFGAPNPGYTNYSIPLPGGTNWNIQFDPATGHLRMQGETFQGWQNYGW